MSPDLATWLKNFLRDRELDHPDGRVLYAYRCTADEFDSLIGVLKDMSFDIGAAPRHHVNVQARAFVLYAAEWWQRRYDGGYWAWEPLLESIGWRHVYYPDLYDPVRAALRWWEVDLVRLPTSVRYLGTFACQGGLPLGLVGDPGSRVAQYLRAVLNHTVEYRRFVRDAIDLARDQQYLLRPPTLRRDYVFRLVADLIDAVLDLRDDAQGKYPINTLDRVRPGWRNIMPLSLENERARNLLTGLLREAMQDRPLTDEFRVERFLRSTSVGWRLGARVRLPESISAQNLARHLNVPENDLRPRMQVRIRGNRLQNVGLYAAQSDKFVLLARDAQSQVEIWDAAAIGEVRLQFLSGGVIGEEVIPYRGFALGELPWAFRKDDHECPFIGEGSVSNRAPKIVLLVPDGCTTDRVSAFEDNIHVGNRTLWNIDELVEIETLHGQCVIRPSSDQVDEEDYCLTGQRCYDLEAAQPLFRGAPKLRISKPGQARRPVYANEVSWRQTGTNWLPRPNIPGLWKVRHIRDGEIRYLSSVGILPEQFRLSLEPDSGMEGDLVLNGTDAVKVYGQNKDISLNIQVKESEVRIRAVVRDVNLPPAKVCLRLHWGVQAQLDVKAPFPVHGGYFLRDGKYLGQKCTVEDLYGIRAIALSPKGIKPFWIYGELKTFDIDKNLLAVANFRRPLRNSGLLYELPLFEMRPMIEQLLAVSSSSEAKVVLRIMSAGRAMAKPNQPEYSEVKRFEAMLEYDIKTTSVCISPSLDDNGDTQVSFESLSLVSPDVHSVFMDNSAIDKIQISKDIDMKDPWLIMVRHGDRMRVQPVVIGGRSGDSSIEDDTERPSLRGAMGLADQAERKHAIVKAIDTMLNSEESNQDEEWSFLTNSLLRSEGLPVTEVDLIKVLISNPKFMVRCIFQLESSPRQILYQLEDKLPFSWLLIERDIWWTEAKQAFEKLCVQLDGISDGENIAYDHIKSILSEATDHIQELCTVKCDIGFRLGGVTIPDQLNESARKERNDKTQEQLILRTTMNDWPKGNGRKAWEKELERGGLLKNIAVWQPEGAFPERQPIFDTPVAAAWCCFKSKPTARTTFLIKRIRAHDPEWFDLAYQAAWFQFAVMQDQGVI